VAATGEAEGRSREVVRALPVRFQAVEVPLPGREGEDEG
jgi:hypothetical protein